MKELPHRNHSLLAFPQGRQHAIINQLPTCDCPAFYSEASAELPLIVGASVPGQPSGLGGVGYAYPEDYRREYYFWFFGYVVKLPYERELSPKDHFAGGTMTYADYSIIALLQDSLAPGFSIHIGGCTIR